MNLEKLQPRQGFKYLRRWSHNRGFTLIEVLVTLVVISVGMLSIAQLQARALQHSHSSLQRSVAVVQANDLLERMWSGYCSPEFWDNKIFDDWDTASAHPLLPGRTATLVPNPDPDADDNQEFTLTISWQDSRARDNTTPSFTYVFRMLDPELTEC